jgi:hypothetical protein
MLITVAKELTYPQPPWLQGHWVGSNVLSPHNNTQLTLTYDTENG